MPCYVGMMDSEDTTRSYPMTNQLNQRGKQIQSKYGQTIKSRDPAYVPEGWFSTFNAGFCGRHTCVGNIVPLLMARERFQTLKKLHPLWHFVSAGLCAPFDCV